MNDRGSITVFALLVIFAVILSFSLYLSNLSTGLVENNGYRVLENASRNIESSYDYSLFRNYGLMAYEEAHLKAELDASVKAGLVSNSGQGLLPYSKVSHYTKDYEKTQDLSDLNAAMDQMVAQAVMQVPKAFIENQNVVKELFDKANAAKSKIKDIDKLTSQLSDLKKFNEDLGKAVNNAKKVNKWISVKVYSDGRIALRDSGLTKGYEDIELQLFRILRNLEKLVQSVEVEKRSLLEDSLLYPDGFTESLINQLDEMMVRERSIIQSGFEVEGIEVEDKFLNIVENSLEPLIKDDIIVDALMERIGTGMAGMMQLHEEVDKLEEDYEVEYDEELSYLESLRKVDDRDAAELRIRIRREIQEAVQADVEEMLERLEVKVRNEDFEKRIDRNIANYVDEINENNLLENDETISEPETGNLSSAVLPPDVVECLPSALYKAKTFDSDLLKQIALTEYIMGTFRNRLSQTLKEDWDFYGKLNRASYFSDGEIEYILIGSKSEAYNRSAVATEIYLLREAANLAHVYTCKEKLKLAGEYSAVVAWPTWTKPIFYHGILIGWASLESADDLKCLLEGEAVTVLKLTDDEWTTSIKGSAEKASAKENAIISSEKRGEQIDQSSSGGKGDDKYLSELNLNEQGYDFYLRFLLNAHGLDQKTQVLRALDVIVLNESKASIQHADREMVDPIDLEDYWTGHKLEMDWTGGGAYYESAY